MVPNDRGIRRVITAGLLLAIILLLCFSPIGFIPTPTPAGSATIAQIPVIIGAILEGPLIGIVLALGFGFGSMLSPLVPIKDPLVIILPRLLIGIVAFWVFVGLRRSNKTVLSVIVALLLVLGLYSSYRMITFSLTLGIVLAVVSVAVAVALYLWIRREDTQIVALALAAAAGSLANTIPVLVMAVVRQLIVPDMAIVIGVAQGIPEAIISAIVVVAVVSAIRQIGRRPRGSRL